MAVRKKPPGRPTKYKAEFVKVVQSLCELGATDPQVAEAIGVNRATLYRWRAKYKDFCNALKVGKTSADDQVERSLYERATGYSHPEDRIFIHLGKPIVVPTVKYYPPDSTALIFWLKNRKPDVWREKSESEKDVEAPPTTINFTISPPAGEVKTTIGKAKA